MYSKKEKNAFMLKWGSIYAACLFVSLGLGALFAAMQGAFTSTDMPVVIGAVVVLAVIIGYFVALKAWKNFVHNNPK